MKHIFRAVYLSIAISFLRRLLDRAGWVDRAKKLRFARENVAAFDAAAEAWNSFSTVDDFICMISPVVPYRDTQEKYDDDWLPF